MEKLENFDFDQFLPKDDFIPKCMLENIDRDIIHAHSKFDPSRVKGADNDMGQTALPVTESINSIYDTLGDQLTEPGRTPDTFGRESKQDVSHWADTELVDHLVSLWTTLKL